MAKDIGIQNWHRLSIAASSILRQAQMALMWSLSIVLQLLCSVFIYIMIFGNLDTKSYKYKAILQEMRGWQNRVRQGIKRLLPDFFVLPGHPLKALRDVLRAEWR
jgi:hypothetical protein